ncbi:MAG: DNA primase, partial [Thermoprotei archaeon]
EEYLETLMRERKGIKYPQAQQEETESEISEIPKEVKDEINKLKGTLEGIIYDEKWKPISRVAVKDLVTRLQELEGAKYVVFDGIITQRIVDMAFKTGIKLVIGARVGDATRIPEEVKISTFDNVSRD